LSARADSNRLAVVPIAPRRGEIVDRNGEVLARKYLSYTLEVVPARAGNLDELFAALTPIVFINTAEQRRFKRRAAESGKYASIVLRNNLNETEAAFFSANALRFAGVHLRARWVREYPQGKSAGHVVGYVGRISESDVAALEERGETGNYRGTDIIGKKGIEKTYETVLHGKAGLEELEVTSRGKPVRVLRRVDPTPGSNLVLSLDMRLQRIAEEAFKDLRGALVAIEPATGDVLAFVSQPSFDPNLFIDGIDSETWKKLNQSLDKPLINRPIRGIYPPGSTFKPFVALAGLHHHKRTPPFSIADPGYYYISGSGHQYRDWKTGGHGMVDMQKAITVSCDTFFYGLALDLGIDKLTGYVKHFGFGEKSGLDMVGEIGGLLPSPEWKLKRYKQKWYLSETIIVGIGQGYMLVTPMQLAQAAAILANDGVAMRPHILKTVEIFDHSKRYDIPVSQVDKVEIDPESLQLVRNGMIDVTKPGGTAASVGAGAPYEVAAKTGTAQVVGVKQGAKYNASAIDERHRDHALFIAYAPAEDPKIALAVIVENGGHGGSAAGPIARQVMDYYLLGKIPKSESDKAPTNNAPEEQPHD
jgi:penicillin-binding protein 2